MSNLPKFELPPPLPAVRRKPPDEGKQKLNSKAEQLAQASSMLTKRLFEGRTVEELAKEYGVERSTVSRRLKLARREGVPEEVRTIFIREALPAAMAVVLDTLASNDEKLRLSAAKMVIEGLEAMKLPEDEREARKAGAGDNDTYEIWRERISISRAKIDSAPTHRGGEESRVIDTTPIPAVEAADPQGDVQAGGDESEEVPLRQSGPDRPHPEAAQDSPSDSAGSGEGGVEAGVSESGGDHH